MQGIGTIKFYNEDKGYGFIKCSDGVEVFFHVSGLLNNWIPKSGDRVNFSVIDGKRGPKAVDVQQV